MKEAAASLTADVAAASTTLRDTTKWMVAGVVATAAGVFAGSSLTHLGSLDPFEDTGRLLLAAGGAALGFAGLAYLMSRALPVLTVDTITLRMLASEPRFAATATVLNSRYGGQFPEGVDDLASLSAKVDQAFEQRRDPESISFLQEVERMRPDMLAEARFLYLRDRFDRMVSALWRAIPLAILGFGIFSWAANPGERAPQESPAPQAASEP